MLKYGPEGVVLFSFFWYSILVEGCIGDFKEARDL